MKAAVAGVIAEHFIVNPSRECLDTKLFTSGRHLCVLIQNVATGLTCEFTESLTQLGGTR